MQAREEIPDPKKPRNLDLIGLLVVALGALYTAFQRNQGVMTKFNKILGGIGSVVNNLLSGNYD